MLIADSSNLFINYPRTEDEIDWLHNRLRLRLKINVSADARRRRGCAAGSGEMPSCSLLPIMHVGLAATAVAAAAEQVTTR